MISNNKSVFSITLIVLAAGTLWGIFEATVGFLLHMLPLNIGWVVWYPVACFFIAVTYRFTKNRVSILVVAVLTAAIKLVDLFLQIRVDKVINPAISIVFEAAAFYIGIVIFEKIAEACKHKLYVKAIFALGINICWRAMFSLYLQLLVPEWMRDLSIISSAEKLTSFWVKENFVTSVIIFIAFAFAERIDFSAIKEKSLSFFKRKKISLAIICALICVDIILQIIL